MKVAFSFAHNPDRPGAKWEGLEEHSTSRRWTRRIVELLQHNGVDAVIVPHHSLRGKVEAINELGADLALEVHFNGCGGCGAKGAETLYYPGSAKGRAAAEAVHAFVAKAASRDRGIKEGWYRQDHPGQVDYDGDVEGDERVLYFLQKTNCPALILEPEFIEQGKQIKRREMGLCRAIADGIEDYLRGRAKRDARR